MHFGSFDETFEKVTVRSNLVKPVDSVSCMNNKRLVAASGEIGF